MSRTPTNLRQLMELKFDPTDADAAMKLAYRCLLLLPYLHRASMSQDHRALIGRDTASELFVGMMNIAQHLNILPDQASGREVKEFCSELTNQPIEAFAEARMFDMEIRAAIGQAMGLAKPGTTEPAKGDWPPLENLLNVIRELVELRRQVTPYKYPLTCHLCNHQIEDESDLIWHGLGNCAELCSRCTGSGEEPKDVAGPLPKIEIYQQDWMPGFAAFVDDDELTKRGTAHAMLNLASFVGSVKIGDIPASEVPYLIAESLMHEVIHVLESWAKVEFSEERAEALLAAYRAKFAPDAPVYQKCEPRELPETQAFGAGKESKAGGKA